MSDFSTYCLYCLENHGFTAPCPHCGSNPVQVPRQEPRFIAAGTTLLNGKYLVGRPIGEGGFGVTYIGRDRAGRKVAIKEFMPAELSGRLPDQRTIAPLHPDFVDRYQLLMSSFLEEGRLMARGQHPNVVTVFDYLAENGTAYLVMEFIEGHSLRHALHLAGGALSPDAAVAIALGLLRGLEAVHSRGILHLDIKPENVMLGARGEVRLIDFGAATRLGTAITHTFLTPGYAPPEAYNESMPGEMGLPADIYGVGATLYEMLVGRAPPDAPRRSAGTALESVTDHVPHARRLSKVVGRALSLDPKARFEDATAFASALEKSRGYAVAPSLPWARLAAGVLGLALLTGGAWAAAVWSFAPPSLEVMETSIILPPPPPLPATSPKAPRPASPRVNAPSTEERNRAFARGHELWKQEKRGAAERLFGVLAKKGDPLAELAVAHLNFDKSTKRRRAKGAAPALEAILKRVQDDPSQRDRVEIGFWVGKVLEHGPLTVRNVERARDWYRRGAEAGDPLAMTNLATLYAYGALGVAKDDGEALKWFTKAARGGVRAARRWCEERGHDY